jgi:hypothetical protein
MAVEGLLAELRAACPFRNSKGCNAEKYAYSGSLCQLMRKHLAQGRVDLRKTTLAEMRREGVPLDIPRSESAHARGSRLDSTYVMTRLHTFRRANPEASRDDIEAERKRCWALWQSLSPEERSLLQPSEDVLPEPEGESLPPAMQGVFRAPS